MRDIVQDLTVESGRIKINMKAIPIGEDLCVIISGGDCPHIGCVTLSVPRPSLTDECVVSATTSVLNLLGHKDDEAAHYVSHELSAKLNKNVVVTCGIHVGNITNDEIKIIIDVLKTLTEAVLQKYI